MEGKALRVHGHIHRKGTYHLTLELPDGTRSFIPASWTDLDGAGPTSGEPSACLSTLIGSVCDLLHARKVVDALLRKLEAQRPSEENRSQEDKHATPTGLLARGKESPLRAGAMGEPEHRGASRENRVVGTVDRQGHLSATDRRTTGEQP